MRTLTVSGRPARIREAGEGPLVLLLHGVPTSSVVWQDVLPLVAAAGWRAVAADLPGWGGTAPLPGPWTIAAHLAWLAELERALGGGPAVHAGQDYGGLLALERAAAGASRGAVATSAWAGLGWAGARITALPVLERLFYRQWGGRLYLRRGSAPARRDALEAAVLPTLDDATVVPRMKAIAEGMSLRRLASLPRRLRASDVPVHFVAGADDPFVPARSIARVARRLDAAFTALPGARHHAPWDRPQAWAAAALAGPSMRRRGG